MNRNGLVKSSNYAWCVMILLTLMQFVYAGLTLSTVTLYMGPILSAHPELSRTAYSLTITLNRGANATISVFYGKFVEKFGMKTMVSVCSLMMIAGVLLYATGTVIWMFYLAAILQGISLCFCSGASCSIIFSKWFAHSTGTLLSITAIGSGLAGVIFSPIVSTWISTIGWTGSLYINCAIVVFTAILLIVFLKDSPEKYGIKPMWNDGQDCRGKRQNHTLWRHLQGGVQDRTVLVRHHWHRPLRAYNLRRHLQHLGLLL